MGREVLATLCLSILVVLVGLSQPVAAKRVALVIGNDDYTEVAKLEKAVNDANTMADTLREIGFEVVRATDVTRREMNRKIQMFASKLDPGDEALFFYAGHGVEIAGRNFLLPVDIPAAKPGHENFITSESIAVDRIVDHIKSRNARISILMLDACRDNPFAKADSRGIGGTRGLARAIAPKGTFIMYSAGVGQLALDRLNREDPNPNSVFTRSVIPLIKRPGLSLVQMARQVRRDVEKLAATVSHDQRPAYYDEVTGDFFFAGYGKVASAPAISQPALANKPASNVWNIIQDTTSKAVLDAFIKEFPKSVFATFAKARLRELRNMPAPDKQPIVVAKIEATRTTEDAAIPGSPPAIVDPNLSRGELSTLVQTELNRIGCSAGRADGDWGKKSRAALQSYVRHASHPVVSREPSVDLLVMLRGEKGRVCPPACSTGAVLKNGQCVARTCRAGQVLSSRGKCVTAKQKTVKTCADGQRANSKGVCYTPKSRTTKAAPSGTGKSKTRTRPTRQVASRSACRGGSINACRSRCSAGFGGACLKVKCMSGNSSACKRLRARSARR